MQLNTDIEYATLIAKRVKLSGENLNWMSILIKINGIEQPIIFYEKVNMECFRQGVLTKLFNITGAISIDELVSNIYSIRYKKLIDCIQLGHSIQNIWCKIPINSCLSIK